MKYLNLGCGSRYHLDWMNIDIVAAGPAVRAHNLVRGIPLADECCDVVYHSHLLEHLRPSDAFRLMKECCRVLKPGGILRVAVPDLERICRVYLEKLEMALEGDQAALEDYDWILLELFDQTVRERSGGAMRSYVSRDVLANESFIYERIGEEGRALIRSVRQLDEPTRDRSINSNARSAPLMWRLRGRLGRLWRGTGHQFVRFWLGAQAVEALRVGQFRLAGEVHQWMYDRFSLARLLLTAGFIEPTQQTATGSRISNWAVFNLDTTSEGVVVKPDSMFMEALKPPSGGSEA